MTSQQLFRPKCLLTQWTLCGQGTPSMWSWIRRGWAWLLLLCCCCVWSTRCLLTTPACGGTLGCGHWSPGSHRGGSLMLWCSEHGKGFGNIGIKSFHFIQNFSDILQWAFWFKEYITDSKMCRYYFKPRDQAKWNGWNSPLAIGRGMAHRLLFTLVTAPWGLGPCHCLVWAALHTVCSAPI